MGGGVGGRAAELAAPASPLPAAGVAGPGARRGFRRFPASLPLLGKGSPGGGSSLCPRQPPLPPAERACHRGGRMVTPFPPPPRSPEFKINIKEGKG